MSYREYRPVEVGKKLDLNELKENHIILGKLWKSIEPEGHRCIKLDDFILIRDSFAKEQSIISVKTPKKTNKSTYIDFASDIQEEIKEIKEKYELSKKDLKRLSKMLKRNEVKQMELEQRISLMQNKALQFKNERDIDKVIKNFERSYSRFNECLSEELKKLDDEDRYEVKILLKDIVKVIEELEPNL